MGAPPTTGLKGNRDFAILWLGDMASELGSAMSMLVFPLLGYALTDSTTQAALATTAFFAAGTIVRVPAGALVDLVAASGAADQQRGVGRGTRAPRADGRHGGRLDRAADRGRGARGSRRDLLLARCLRVVARGRRAREPGPGLHAQAGPASRRVPDRPAAGRRALRRSRLAAVRCRCDEFRGVRGGGAVPACPAAGAGDDRSAPVAR